MFRTRKNRSDAAAILLIVQKSARYMQKEMLAAKVAMVGFAFVAGSKQFHRSCMNYMERMAVLLVQRMQKLPTLCTNISNSTKCSC